jgi:hypothetical protein
MRQENNMGRLVLLASAMEMENAVCDLVKAAPPRLVDRLYSSLCLIHRELECNRVKELELTASMPIEELVDLSSQQSKAE